MRKSPALHVGFAAGLGLFLLSSASAQISFNAGSPYTQNFDSLPVTGTGSQAWSDGSTLPGWYASKSVSPTTVSGINIGSGTANNGALYSFGTTNAPDRALGSVASGTPGNIAYGVLFLNDTGLAVTNITITYTGEQWRNGGNTSTQTLTFSYFVSSTSIAGSDAGNANAWVPFHDLDFNSPTVGASPAALDGNAPANRQTFPNVLLTNAVVYPNQEVFFRWYDSNDAGNDHALAIDDLSISFTTTPFTLVPAQITDQPVARTNNAGTTAIFTVTATGSALSYQWRKDGSDIGNSLKYSGVTSPILVVSNLTSIDVGNYSVVVANALPGGTSSTSADASLTVIDPALNSPPVSRTNLVGDTADFFVGAAGTIPLSYQWRFNGADIADATGSSLQVPAFQTNVGDYTVVVMNVSGDSITSAPVSLTLLATPASLLARWDFNATNTLPVSAPTPSSGAGTASLTGGVKATFATGSFSDPAALPGPDNSAWNCSSFAAQGTSNKLTGVQFNVGTVGYQDLLLAWEQRHSDTASKYLRLQYSTDGATFSDGPLITMSLSNNSFAFYTADLSSVAGLNNNPNAAFRLVSEFESTAIGTANDNYVGTVSGYSTGGTVRLDLFTVFGNNFTGVAPIPLKIQQIGDHVVLTWSNPAFSLTSSTSVSGTFNKLSNATSPYTNTSSGNALFFRLVYP